MRITIERWGAQRGRLGKEHKTEGIFDRINVSGLHQISFLTQLGKNCNLSNELQRNATGVMMIFKRGPR